jgi:hypothetical protein
MGWAHHTRWFVDPEDREPYWTRHHREIDEAQDDWAQERAAGAGVGEARPLISPSAVVEQPDLLAPARAGSQAAGVRSRSHHPRSM